MALKAYIKTVLTIMTTKYYIMAMREAEIHRVPN